MRYDEAMPKPLHLNENKDEKGRFAPPPQLDVTDPRIKIYIAHVAAGFTRIGEDGWPKRIKKKDLAKKLGVHRSMFGYWKKNVPNFGKLVEAAREKEFERRTIHVENALYLGALKQDTAAQKLYFRQRGILKPEKQDINLSGGLTVDDALNELDD
jgi:hypothetical protein